MSNIFEMLDIYINHRIGYFGEQRDKESDYFAMGFRLYDPEIGRFLAIDPLLDVQPSQTPYHYCFNNPTSFTDPTGLYPEKEKGDKVQVSVTSKPEIMENTQNLLKQYFNLASITSPIYEEQKSFMRAQWEQEYLARISMPGPCIIRVNGVSGVYGIGSPGSSSGRTGTNESGNGAWAVTNEWNDEYEKQYGDFAVAQAEKYKAEGRKFTCEDLALQVLIDFASQNNLPIEITNASGTYNPLNYSDIETFTNDVLRTTGANDLINYNNTTIIDINSVIAGDLLVERKNGTIGNHVQLTRIVTDQSIYTIQGNANWLSSIPGSSRFLYASNPKSPFYCGSSLTYGRIVKLTGNYYNFSTSRFVNNYILNYNTIGVRWNFKKW